MTEKPRSLFDELLELAVYVPVGLATRVLDQVPGLAAAGRERIGSQVDQARVIGRFAVGLARSKAARSFTTAAPRPAPRPKTEPPAPSPPTPATRQATPPAQPSAAEPSAGAAPQDRPAAPQAIPDYDALSASQVVPRLQGLSQDELAAIARYESTTRRRRTILNKIAQLERELGGR